MTQKQKTRQLQTMGLKHITGSGSGLEDDAGDESDQPQREDEQAISAALDSLGWLDDENWNEAQLELGLAGADHTNPIRWAGTKHDTPVQPYGYSIKPQRVRYTAPPLDTVDSLVPLRLSN